MNSEPTDLRLCETQSQHRTRTEIIGLSRSILETEEEQAIESQKPMNENDNDLQMKSVKKHWKRHSFHDENDEENEEKSAHEKPGNFLPGVVRW